jgi:hypothetical protein
VRALWRAPETSAEIRAAAADLLVARARHDDQKDNTVD